MGTYTGTDKLYKPTLGEQGWDDEVNLNFDRLAEHVANVKSYGAVGNGSTNDTTAINVAIAAISSGILFFPAGTYIVDAATLNLKANVAWVGVGMGASIIKLKDAGNGKIINYVAGPISNVMFRDLGFDGNMMMQTDGASRDDRAGIFVREIDGLSVIRCSFTGVRSGAAIRAFGCDDILYLANIFEMNGIRALLQVAYDPDTVGGTITVDSTTGWASAGKLQVKNAILSYTGKTGTTFTGVNLVTPAGPHPTMNANSWVVPVTNDANNRVLICDATFTGTSKRYRAIGNRFMSNTDTGTALDGVMQGVVGRNHYEENVLGVGIGFSNAEQGGAADSCEALVISDNVIMGLGQSSIECQGIKAGSFGNTGDGQNNRMISISQNIIMQCDRALWLDTLEDTIVQGNHFHQTTGPNGQLVMLAPSGTAAARLHIIDNHFKTAATGILFNTGTITECVIQNNFFHTDVTVKISGSSTSSHVRQNRGYNPLGTASITVTASPFTYTNNDSVPETVHIQSGSSTNTHNIQKNGNTIYTHPSGTTIRHYAIFLEPSESLTYTTTSGTHAPTMWKDRK